METLIKKLVNAKSGEVKALFWSFAYFFFLLSTYYMLLPIARCRWASAAARRTCRGCSSPRSSSRCSPRHCRRRIAAKLPRRAVRAGDLPVPRRQHAGVLVPAEDRRFARRGVARRSSSGSPCSRCSRCRCSGRSCPTSTPASRASACSASSRRADRWATSWGRCSTSSWSGRIGVANLLLVAGALLIGAVFCANRLEGAAAQLRRPRTRISSRPAPVARRSPWAAACSTASGCCSSRPTWAASACGCSCCRCWARSCTSRRRTSWPRYTDDMAQRTQHLRDHRTVGGHPVAGGAGAGHGPHHQGASASGPRAGHPAAGVRRRVHRADVHLRRCSPSPAFQACSAPTNFGIANVARESLWTVVSREEKFKAKNIVDGAVFRGADFVNAFIFTGLCQAACRAAGARRHRRVLAAAGSLLSLALGRTQEKRAREAKQRAGLNAPPTTPSLPLLAVRVGRSCCCAAA